MTNVKLATAVATFKKDGAPWKSFASYSKDETNAVNRFNQLKGDLESKNGIENWNPERRSIVEDARKFGYTIEVQQVAIIERQVV